MPTPSGRPRHDDRGSASVEWALGAVVLMSILLLIGHAFTWGVARLAAQTAVGHAVQTARVIGGTPEAGQADAAALLDGLRGGDFTARTITVRRTATQTTVTITGSTPTLVPGLRLPVSVTRTAPTERYTPP